MDNPSDPYATLGVKRDASAAEVRRVYRKLAVKYHPDKNAGNKAAETRFKEISQAYGILSDPDKRKKHDSVQFAPPAPPPNYPVADVSVEVEITAKDFENGADKTVTVSRPRMCPDCGGSGQISRSQYQVCVLCQGSGCHSCGFSGSVTTNHCAKCWGSGNDKELAVIAVRIPPGTPPHGRQKLVANGYLWGLKGPFFVHANITFRVNKPGLIVR